MLLELCAETWILIHGPFALPEDDDKISPHREPVVIQMKDVTYSRWTSRLR